MPPQDKWTSVEKSLYGVVSPYSLSGDEVEKICLQAIQYSFSYHYSKNSFYRKFCQENGIEPEDIRSFSKIDFLKIIQ
ncbi:hypothetical protein J7K28_03100 [Candidatus Aerophobetes bacterium]|nr:hypothetical protein [Candidatus Aerophobetes bacterium]